MELPPHTWEVASWHRMLLLVPAQQTPRQLHLLFAQWRL